MNRKTKMAVDVAMTVSLLFLMGYQFWGEIAHEWVGAGIFILFIAHHIWNRSWYGNLFRGKYPPARIFQICVNMLTLLSMIVLMYSSIVLSRYIFVFLPIDSGLALARRLHILGSYWGFLLMGMHLGLHWNMVLGMVKHSQDRTKTGREKVCSALGLASGLYGAWVFVKRDFFTYLFLQSEYVFLDYEESKMMYYVDYLALMGMCVFISHYIGKCLQLLKRKESEP